VASQDDSSYRKSVRNMVIILTVIVFTIFAAIFVPPYVNPYRDVFSPSTSYASPVGFIMHLTLNTTSVSPSGGILMVGWLNSSEASTFNITAANQWAIPQAGLWGKICTSGWPIGVGVMQGHFTQDNYTLGALIPILQPLVECPVRANTPSYFLLEPAPHSSKALVVLGGAPYNWVLQSQLSFKGYLSGYQLHRGVYTAVLADEWGDVITANFRVT
jgi:hypothetical protein